MGPFITKGDINGDGLGRYLCRRSFRTGQPGALFVNNGIWVSLRKLVPLHWKMTSAYEDMEAVFFDLDGDKRSQTFM